MTKVKVAEATGSVLDWMVAKCEGALDDWDRRLTSAEAPHFYSTDWSQGGPIIERKKLCVGYKHQADPEYCPINDLETNCWARTTAGGYLSYGPTPLIAAMRCHVTSKLGDVVDVPQELVSSNQGE